MRPRTQIDEWVDAGAMLLEPRHVFDQALLGTTESADGLCVAAYDTAKCIRAIMAAEGWSQDEATDWFEYNTCGSCVGPGSPIFIEPFSE